MVVTQLLGGLGNQMFQYAIGRHLAIINNTQLLLDKSILTNWKPGKHAVNRDFDLDIFSLDSFFADRLITFRYHTDGALLPVKLLGRIVKPFFKEQYIRETSFAFDENVFEKKGDIYLSGTWQSYKYFLGIEKIIRSDFIIKEPFNQNSKELLQVIKSSNKSICLNVRKTDYLNVNATASIMKNIGVDYYEHALSVLESNIGNDFELFIFSDDLNWCMQHLNHLEYKKTFVSHEYAGRKFSNYLQLMMACNHFIIPNSTFAWWAAWLSNTTNKIIITPKVWFNNTSVNTDDLIPPTWIRL